MTSAYGRFSILLLCAFAALIAVVTPGQHHATAATKQAAVVERIVQPSTPLDPPRPLQRLWLTDLRARFPSMTTVLASRFSILPDHQIVSYYGNPYSDLMGILGASDLESTAAALEQHAARYAKLHGPPDGHPGVERVIAVPRPPRPRSRSRVPVATPSPSHPLCPAQAPTLACAPGCAPPRKLPPS